jgi:hypothetical protein
MVTKLNKNASSFFPKEFATKKQEVPQPKVSAIYPLIIQILDQLFPKPISFVCDYTFGQYICRVAEINRISDESLVVSLTYLHRIYNFRSRMTKQEDKEDMDQWWQLHRFAVSGLRLANKYLEDVCVNNQTFAESVGCPVKTINEWERDFFQFMSFDLHVDHSDYFTFLQFLKSLSVPLPKPLPLLDDFILQQKITSFSSTSLSSTDSPSELREINNAMATAWFAKLSKPDRLSISHHWLMFDCTQNASGPVSIHLSKKEIVKKARDEFSNCIVFVEPSI